MKKWFCYVSNIWLHTVVGSSKSPVTKIMDLLWGSDCKYCMSVRVGLAGFGTAAAIFGGIPATIFGLALIVVSIALTMGERYWNCDTL